MTARGMPAWLAEPRRVFARLAVSVSLAFALAGCKPPADAMNPVSGFVSGGTDVAITSVREVAPGDAVAQSSDEYYLVTFVWTNTVGRALSPRVDHFVLEDRDRRRFLGAVSGSPALIGIANADGVLAPNATRTYTIGFRVPQATVGTVFYDDSF